MQKFVINKDFLDSSAKPEEQIFLILNDAPLDKDIFMDLIKKCTTFICSDGAANFVYDAFTSESERYHFVLNSVEIVTNLTSSLGT